MWGLTPALSEASRLLSEARRGTVTGATRGLGGGYGGEVRGGTGGEGVRGGRLRADYSENELALIPDSAVGNCHICTLRSVDRGHKRLLKAEEDSGVHHVCVSSVVVSVEHRVRGRLQLIVQ